MRGDRRLKNPWPDHEGTKANMSAMNKVCQQVLRQAGLHRLLLHGIHDQNHEPANNGKKEWGNLWQFTSPCLLIYLKVFA